MDTVTTRTKADPRLPEALGQGSRCLVGLRGGLLLAVVAESAEVWEKRKGFDDPEVWVRLEVAPPVEERTTYSLGGALKGKDLSGGIDVRLSEIAWAAPLSSGEMERAARPCHAYDPAGPHTIPPTGGTPICAVCGHQRPGHRNDAVPVEDAY